MSPCQFRMLFLGVRRIHSILVAWRFRIPGVCPANLNLVLSFDRMLKPVVEVEFTFFFTHCACKHVLSSEIKPNREMHIPHSIVTKDAKGDTVDQDLVVQRPGLRQLVGCFHVFRPCLVFGINLPTDNIVALRVRRSSHFPATKPQSVAVSSPPPLARRKAGKAWFSASAHCPALQQSC